MRDTRRIARFCNSLAKIWEENVPDWRFGQLICNVFGEMQSNGIDPFFPEDKEMMTFFMNYFVDTEEKF